jgi:hypothetical protein
VATKCYAMVKGSSIRVTGLGSCGEMTSPIRYATSKSVAIVTVNEVTESGNTELVRNEEDDSRLLLTDPEQTIRYTVDIDFIRVDPGVLALVAGVPTVQRAGTTEGGLGFGEGGFGEGGFGGGGDPSAGAVVGFDSIPRRPLASFGLEVWSRLAGMRCAETGLPQWGYTLLPFLRGGYLSGFSYDNALVSFNLRGAQTRKVPRWGVGPYDLEGPHERLIEVVSRNTAFKTMLTTAPPPAQQDGIVETTDIIDGGSASTTTSDVVDGEFVVTSPWIVEGGRAL